MKNLLYFIFTISIIFCSSCKHSQADTKNIRKSDYLEPNYTARAPARRVTDVKKTATVSQRAQAVNQNKQTSIFSNLPSCRIIPRSSWATVKTFEASRVTPMGGKPRFITVHHTTEEGNLDKCTDLEFLRKIEKSHINYKKWACIGYHYIISKNGKIYEGRPLYLQGAHVAGKNELNIGVSLMGDFSKEYPNVTQVRALASLLKYLRAKYGIKYVYGHCDLGKTECPGRFLVPYLKKLK